MFYECQEGFDVPLAVLEKRHHRTRARPDSNPHMHGAHFTCRRHAKPHVLARRHTWASPWDEELVSTSCEEGSEEGSEKMETGKLHPKASSEPSLAHPEAITSWVLPFGYRTAVPEEDKTPEVTFAERLLANLDGGDGAHVWPKVKQVRLLTPPPKPPTLSVERLVSRAAAEAAAGRLPQLVEEHLAEFEDEISFAQMVGLLKHAVDYETDLEHSKENKMALETTGTGASAGPINIDGHCDLRGRGWTRQHKASHNFKIQQRMEEKQEEVWQKCHLYYGLPAAMFEPGSSWRFYNKRRSKQHGGQLRGRRGQAGWVEQ